MSICGHMRMHGCATVLMPSSSLPSPSLSKHYVCEVAWKIVLCTLPYIKPCPRFTPQFINSFLTTWFREFNGIPLPLVPCTYNTSILRTWAFSSYVYTSNPSEIGLSILSSIRSTHRFPLMLSILIPPLLTNPHLLVYSFFGKPSRLVKRALVCGSFRGQILPLFSVHNRLS